MCAYPNQIQTHDHKRGTIGETPRAQKENAIDVGASHLELFAVLPSHNYERNPVNRVYSGISANRKSTNDFFLTDDVIA